MRHNIFYYICGLLAVLLLMIPFQGNAARNITLPFSDNFNTDNDSDLYWHSGTDSRLTSVVEWTSDQGYGNSGGIKITPPYQALPDNGEYGGIGTFYFDSGVTELHVRVLVKFGPTYASTTSFGTGNAQNKFIISRGSAERTIASYMHWDSPSLDYSVGPCHNSICQYNNGEGTGYDYDDYYPTPQNPYHLTDYANQWVAIEHVMNASTGQNDLYVWTQDGAISGLYKEWELSTLGGQYTEVQIIGGFFNGIHTQDPDNWIILDEVQFSESYIGPPTGFVSGGTDQVSNPSAPSSVTVDSTASVAVNYDASTDRDVYVVFEQDTTPFTEYASVKVDVTAGSGTVSLPAYSIPDTVPVAAGAYRFQFYITDDGGDYASRLSTVEVSNIDAVSAPAATSLFSTGSTTLISNGAITLTQ